MKRLLPLPLLALAAPHADAQATNPPLTPCTYEDRAAKVDPAGDGRFTVLDTVMRLPEDFVPSGLVPLREAGFADDRLVRDVIIPDLTALREAAERDGIALEIFSAYRSYAYQAETFAYWVNVQGEEAARATSARPGHSEHQLGTAIDVGTAGGPAPWDLDDWALTPEGAWMQTNAWRYGFVLSYPRDSRDVTCYAYEPWHWRWVGQEMAATIREAGVPPRVYLWHARATMSLEDPHDP